MQNLSWLRSSDPINHIALHVKIVTETIIFLIALDFFFLFLFFFFPQFLPFFLPFFLSFFLSFFFSFLLSFFLSIILICTAIYVRNGLPFAHIHFQSSLSSCLPIIFPFFFHTFFLFSIYLSPLFSPAFLLAIFMIVNHWSTFILYPSKLERQS